MSESAANFCGNCGSAIESEASFCSGCGREFGAPAYAGFWIRLAAALIDGVILGIVNFIVGAIVGFPASLFISLLIGFTYTVGFWMSSGATPGKMLLGLQVTTESGDNLDFGQSFIRYIGYYVSTITLFIGYLMIAFRSDKRGLHDLMAGTIVVKK